MGTDKLDVGNKASFFIQAQLCIYLMRLQFEALPNPLKAEECPSTLAYRWPKCSEWIKRVELSIYIKKKRKKDTNPTTKPKCSHDLASLLCAALSPCCSAVFFLFSCGRTVPLATSAGL